MKFVIFCAFFDITTMQQSHLFFQHFLPSFIYDLLYFQLQDVADDGLVSRCQSDKNKYNIVYFFCIYSHIFLSNWKYCLRWCAFLRCACAVYCATIKLAVFKDKRKTFCVVVLCKLVFVIGVFSLPIFYIIVAGICDRPESSFWCVARIC